MISSKKGNFVEDLETAKVNRRKAAAAVDEAAIRAKADAADLLLSGDEVRHLEQRRAGAIASCDPAAAIAVDDALRKAQIAVEIATSRAAASTAQHAQCVAELHECEGRVTGAAAALIDADMIAMANEFTEQLDRALALGAKLEELSLRDHRPMPMGAASTTPAVVTRALARLPKVHPLDTPISQLRAGFRMSTAWRERLDVLSADGAAL